MDNILKLRNLLAQARLLESEWGTMMLDHTLKFNFPVYNHKKERKDAKEHYMEWVYSGTSNSIDDVIKALEDKHAVLVRMDALQKEIRELETLIREEFIARVKDKRVEKKE
jgi:hypothetical protein